MLSSLTAATIFNPLLEIPTSPGRCPSYDCLQPSHVTDFYSTCLIYNASALTYSSLSCNNYFLLNNFCDTSSLDLKNSSTYTVRCTPPSLNYTNLYPGEGPCFKNKNCVSQICENYVCQGVEISSPCNYTYQCEQGLVCEGMDPSLNETGTCSFALRPGHGLCTSDFDCCLCEQRRLRPQRGERRTVQALFLDPGGRRGANLRQSRVHGLRDRHLQHLGQRHLGVHLSLQLHTQESDSLQHWAGVHRRQQAGVLRLHMRNEQRGTGLLRTHAWRPRGPGAHSGTQEVDAEPDHIGLLQRKKVES